MGCQHRGGYQRRITQLLDSCVFKFRIIRWILRLRRLRMQLCAPICQGLFYDFSHLYIG